MKQNSTFTSILALLVTVLLFTIASLLLSSCSGIRYTYFDKKKVPCKAAEETEFAKAIPAKPFLNQSQNELKEKVSTPADKNSKPADVAENNAQKKSEPAATTLEQVINEKNIAKYIPRQLKGTQSENDGPDRDLMIVILIVAILIVIALLGDDLLWLLFLALLILLIYVLVKYLGIFN